MAAFPTPRVSIFKKEKRNQQAKRYSLKMVEKIENWEDHKFDMAKARFLKSQ